MNPFEPLKYEKPLMALKARLAEEGPKAVFSPLIEKYILNNPHCVTVEMQVSILPSVIYGFYCILSDAQHFLISCQPDQLHRIAYRHGYIFEPRQKVL